MTQEIVSTLPESVASRVEGPAIAGRIPKLKSGKWPKLYTLAFIGLTCGAFWLAAAFGLFRIL